MRLYLSFNTKLKFFNLCKLLAKLRKNVYCKINERIKRLSYNLTADSTDLMCLQNAFQEARKKDNLLNAAVYGKEVVFLCIDKKRRLCDIKNDIVSIKFIVQE